MKKIGGGFGRVPLGDVQQQHAMLPAILAQLVLAAAQVGRDRVGPLRSGKLANEDGVIELAERALNQTFVTVQRCDPGQRRHDRCDSGEVSLGMQDLLRRNRRLAEYLGEGLLAELLRHRLLENHALVVGENEGLADVQRGALEHRELSGGVSGAVHGFGKARGAEQRLAQLTRQKLRHHPRSLALHHRHTGQRGVIALPRLADEALQIEILIG